MPSLFDAERRHEVLERIGRLAPDRKPRWGRFTAPEMVCHVSCDLRHGLGELATGPPTGLLAHAPFNWLAIHVVPWPKGRGKSPPEFLATRPTTWQADVSRLRDLIGRFADRGPAGKWPASRVFGRISGRSWGVMLYKHLDHHLRQFGA
jgi:hypothetical protein